MATGGNLGQGFPQIQMRLIDASGNIAQPWLQLLISLWNRTGGATAANVPVPYSRVIGTIAPLAGGGNLSEDRTLFIQNNGIGTNLLAQVPEFTLRGNNTGATATILNLSRAEVSALIQAFITINENQVTNLTTDLAARALTSTQIIAGNGLSGGGDLSANRTLTLTNTVKTVNFAASPYTVLATDCSLAVDASGGAVTINLPTAVGKNGRQLTTKKIDATGNAVTLTVNGAQTIDGAGTYVLAAQWNGATINSDGANWLIEAKV